MQMRGLEKLALHRGCFANIGQALTGREKCSDTKPAKFLVFLVKDKDAPLLIPVNE